jgi:hypothetical protein
MKLTFSPDCAAAHRATALVFAIVLAAVVGCGKRNEASIHGNVTLDGKPLTTGNVSFHPVAGGPVAYGTIQSDGTYKIFTGSVSGLPAGEYRVTVVATEMLKKPAQGEEFGKLLTPAEFGSPEKTPLKFQVQAGDNTIDIPVKSSPSSTAK